jgi:dienelactone hydrolase
MIGRILTDRAGRSARSPSRKNALDLIRRAYPAGEFDLMRFVAAGRFMQSSKVFFALAALAAVCAQGVVAQTRFGAQGAEGEPNRRQPWLVPSPDPDVAAHAFLFRPPGDGPFPLVVIAHASTQNALRRAQMPQPEYAALSAWLVARGFAVLVPERPGHGGTGGKYLEDQGGCDEANYSRAGHATADSITAALNFLRDQPFIRPDGAVVVGHSAGAWGALALAGGSPKGVSVIIAFAPGRGGRANDIPNQICAPRTLISAAAEFGQNARVPVLWLVSANDTYFPPELSRQLADAFRAGGGKVDFRVLAAYGGEGHWLAETDDGIRIAGPELERALKALSPGGTKKR